MDRVLEPLEERFKLVDPLLQNFDAPLMPRSSCLGGRVRGPPAATQLDDAAEDRRATPRATTWIAGTRHGGTLPLPLSLGSRARGGGSKTQRAAQAALAGSPPRLLASHMPPGRMAAGIRQAERRLITGRDFTDRELPAGAGSRPARAEPGRRCWRPASSIVLPPTSALARLALAAAVFAGAGNGVRAGLAVVAVAGVAAAVLIVALPRLVASRRTLRFRLGRWLSPRTTSLRRGSQAWALVSICWVVRAAALFLLLGPLGIGYSFPLALLFLCAGAAAAALPIGSAGATTQVGGGAAALLASGVGASQALSIAVSVAALGVLSGTAILLFAIADRSGRSLTPTRAAA
jgi:hypothetical protein